MSKVPTKIDQGAATPRTVLARLEAGNARFVAGGVSDRDWAAEVAATASGQFPLAAFVSCIDSRVPPEIVFDLGLGEAFAARTAGNVVDDDVLGSLEFAAAIAGVKVIVVLGHTACGAVKGACDGAELEHLTGLLAKITPAVQDVTGETAPGSGDPELVTKVVGRHVERMVVELTDRSETLRALVDQQRLAVVGAIYDLESATVTWMGSSPNR